MSTILSSCWCCNCTVKAWIDAQLVLARTLSSKPDSCQGSQLMFQPFINITKNASNFLKPRICEDGHFGSDQDGSLTWNIELKMVRQEAADYGILIETQSAGGPQQVWQHLWSERTDTILGRYSSSIFVFSVQYGCGCLYFPLAPVTLGASVLKTGLFMKHPLPLAVQLPTTVHQIRQNHIHTQL